MPILMLYLSVVRLLDASAPVHYHGHRPLMHIVQYWSPEKTNEEPDWLARESVEMHHHVEAQNLKHVVLYKQNPPELLCACADGCVVLPQVPAARC